MARMPARMAGGREAQASISAVNSGSCIEEPAGGEGSCPRAPGLPQVQPPVQRPEGLDVSAASAGLRTTPRPLPKLDVEGSSPFARSCCVAAKPRGVLLLRGFAGRSQSSPV